MDVSGERTGIVISRGGSNGGLVAGLILLIRLFICGRKTIRLAKSGNTIFARTPKPQSNARKFLRDTRTQRLDTCRRDGR